MIQQRDVLAGAVLERGVGGRGDTAGTGLTDDRDAGIGSAELVEGRDHARLRAAVVDEHELPVAVALGDHGVQCFGQHRQRWVVHRTEDRDHRSVGDRDRRRRTERGERRRAGPVEVRFDERETGDGAVAPRAQRLAADLQAHRVGRQLAIDRQTPRILDPRQQTGPQLATAPAGVDRDDPGPNVADSVPPVVRNQRHASAQGHRIVQGQRDDHGWSRRDDPGATVDPVEVDRPARGLRALVKLLSEGRERDSRRNRGGRAAPAALRLAVEGRGGRGLAMPCLRRTTTFSTPLRRMVSTSKLRSRSRQWKTTAARSA